MSGTTLSASHASSPLILTTQIGTTIISFADDKTDVKQLIQSHS